ncbi:MAG TPA: SPOR domain-containing protein [Candidatus Marinimicrobia bacterium]|nr:SPOR domain-containing protein [Candidatus Neomarinimicrobiota bacterium]|tara:strand:- start:14 stop:400 length:387 start_codon:yes stop_codon:yes gene_type:complete
MIKYYLLLFLSFSTIYTQEVNDKWLDTILEKNVPVKKSQILDKEEKQKNNTYFTIQVAAKASFADAQEVVKILNNSNFEAFIQKNDSNDKLKYRVRYGSFLSREDASMTANDIKNQLGYDCWVDKIEL